MTLSVCIIARDEEDTLPQCLESLRGIYDELLIGLDTRSTDRTEAIARAYGARIIPIQWPENDQERDFAAARNQLEDAATCDYVYVQDADEILVAGHDAIREIVAKGEITSVRPLIVYSRDALGRRQGGNPRQDVLHKKGSHRWHGKYHEWTEMVPGADYGLGQVRPDIEIDPIERPGGDRPHGDQFKNLRSNFLDAMREKQLPWPERHLFYLEREHAGAPLTDGLSGHEQEAIALAMLMLKKAPVVNYIERSHACIIAGDACKRLGEARDARNWYLKAVREWAAWAEPYYALGVLCHDLGMKQVAEGSAEHIYRALFNEAAGWLLASTIHEPPAYFVDFTIYDYRRYQALSVALARVGRLEESVMWMKRALEAQPADEEMTAQLALIEDAMKVAA